RGGEYIGTPPTIAVNGPDDVGSGRFIPTLSVDQLAASLGQWFGLSTSEQQVLLPNLANFSQRTLPLFR
ncbi:MAG: Tat pathway signal protein, partial [Betaproteobacteria bacterium]|nr:Tat pathway signal protein [Betaproteobacteria bacterium]